MQFNINTAGRAKMRLERLGFAFCLFILKCFFPIIVFACEGTIRQTHDQIYFSGCISKPLVAELVKIVSSNADAALYINSEGGDVEAAIELAHQLLKNPRKIFFDKQCSSSCANYLLPVGSPGLLTSNLIVVLHGDAKIVLEEVSRTPSGHAALAHLKRIAGIEDEFRKKSPQAELLHQVQRIGRAAVGAKILVNLDGKELVCTGLGLTNINLDPKFLTAVSLNWVNLPINVGTHAAEPKALKQYDITSDLLSNCSNAGN